MLYVRPTTSFYNNSDSRRDSCLFRNPCQVPRHVDGPKIRQVMLQLLLLLLLLLR